MDYELFCWHYVGIGLWSFIDIVVVLWVECLSGSLDVFLGNFDDDVLLESQKSLESW